MGALHVSDANFKEEILDAKIPCVVDFWAEWCGPCKMIAPIVEGLADEFSGRVKIAKLNVDDGQKTASQYGVMSIPTLMFFKDGRVAGQVVGALAKEALKAKIEELLV